MLAYRLLRLSRFDAAVKRPRPPIIPIAVDPLIGWGVEFVC